MVLHHKLDALSQWINTPEAKRSRIGRGALFVGILTAITSFLFMYSFNDLIGSDRAHIYIIKDFQIPLALSFNLEAVNTYRPLSVFLEHSAAHFYYVHGNAYHLWFVLLAAVLNGLSASIIFGIAFLLLDSATWAFAATILGAFTTAHITSTWYTLFSIFEIGPLVIVGSGIFGYLKYRATGAKPWLLLFVASSLIGPWFREIGVLSAVVVTCMEVLRLPRRFSPLFVLSGLLALHGLFPTALPHLFGWYQFDIQFLLNHGEIAANYKHNQINWIRPGRIINELPPILMLVAVIASGAFITSLFSRPFTLKALYNALCEKGLAIIPMASGVESSRFRGLFLGAGYTLFALYAVTTIYFSGPEPHTSGFHGLHRELALLVFLPIFMAVSALRFGALAPVWFMASYTSLVRFLATHETHQLFISIPLCIIIAFWLRDLLQQISAITSASLRRWLLTMTIPCLVIGFLDQIATIPAAFMANAAIRDDLQEMSNQIRSRVEKNSLLLVNFFPAFEVQDRNKGYFQLRWISSFGPVSHLPDHKVAYEYQDQIKAIQTALDANVDIYYLLLLSKNFEGQYLLPQATLRTIQTFIVDLIYFHIDPLRYLISTPSYVQYFGPTQWVYTFDQMHPFVGHHWPTTFQLYKLDRAEALELVKKPLPNVSPGSPPQLPIATRPAHRVAQDPVAASNVVPEKKNLLEYTLPENNPISVLSNSTVHAKASKTATGHGLPFLFDGKVEPNSFWEAEPFPYPFTLDLLFQEPYAVREYTFGVGEVASRMPSAWSFEGRGSDSQKWEILDKQSDVKWTKNSSQTFNIAKPNPFQQYRLTFSSGGSDLSAQRIYELTLK